MMDLQLDGIVSESGKLIFNDEETLKIKNKLINLNEITVHSHALKISKGFLQKYQRKGQKEISDLFLVLDWWENEDNNYFFVLPSPYIMYLTKQIKPFDPEWIVSFWYENGVNLKTKQNQGRHRVKESFVRFIEADRMGYDILFNLASQLGFSEIHILKPAYHDDGYSNPETTHGETVEHFRKRYERRYFYLPLEMGWEDVPDSKYITRRTKPI
jgi:hypothetical protein